MASHPLRIFSLTKDPYVLYKGQRLPIKALSQSQLIKLNLLKNKSKKKIKQKKVGTIPDIEDIVKKHVRSIVQKRPPNAKMRRPRAETKNNTALQNLNIELNRRKFELENELRQTKFEKTKLEIQKEKAETEKAKEELQKEEIKTHIARHVPALPAPPVEDNKNFHNELAVAKYARKVHKLTNKQSGKYSFDELKRIQVIPERYNYYPDENIPVRERKVGDFGWKDFLMSEVHIPEKDLRTRNQISAQRKEWILENAEQIANKYVVAGDGEAKIPEDGAKGLYDFEIDEFFEGMHGWYGAISKEDIYSVMKSIIKDKPKYFYFIYLIENYQEQKSNHWVALFFDDLFDKSFSYFDSYGKDAPKDLHRKLDLLLEALQVENYVDWKFNKKQQQGYTTNCGLFCINYVMERLLGHDHLDACKYNDNEAMMARSFLK